MRSHGPPDIATTQRYSNSGTRLPRTSGLANAVPIADVVTVVQESDR
jgi:hypothetical protein